MGSILYMHELPPVGGDTLFASMYAAYDQLSEPMKRLLEGMTAMHARDAADVVRPRARAARREIRADVQRDGDAKPEELAVRVERQLRRRDVVAAVLVGDEPLAAIRRPLHRTAEPLRDPEHQHVLGVRAALHPEASADRQPAGLGD